MNAYLFLPLQLLKFWYIDSPRDILGFFQSFNSAFFQVFSLPLFLRTFFKPLKNEYREGLVRFSIVMGMMIKSMLIFVDLLLLLIIFIIEVGVLLAFLAFPIATVLLLFL